MKRIMSQGYTCKLCDSHIHLTRPNTYVRCLCGHLGLFGRPDAPVVATSEEGIALKGTDTILMVPDDYRAGPPGTAIVVSRKAASIYGMPKDVLDFVMPMLSIGQAMGWDGGKLIDAAKALISYDQMLRVK